MRIFLSAGEPSGDLHGANLIHALRRLDPAVECVGFGGERMEAAGCRLLYPLCRLAVMWFLRVLLNAPTFLRLLRDADRFFAAERPDAVVLIDYPGFNWIVARLAHARGIPVFYFVAPQLWAWYPGRVRKMQRWVDHVLCSLPFEEAWYQSRGVAAHYIGHPYFDELPRQRADEAFLTEQRRRPGPVVGLLPGSRHQEIDRNLPTLLRATALVHAARPDARFLVACLHAEQARRVADAVARRRAAGELPGGAAVEVCHGRTSEVIRLARACIAVSGSVGLELLYHEKPSVVVYRLRRIDMPVARFFITCRYISLVNLLAGRELFPEYLTPRCEAPAAAAHVLRWLNDDAVYAELCGELADLRRRVAEPGACDRAAEYLLRTLAERRRTRAA